MVLNDNGTFVYQREKELKVTRNSVSFEDNVYQLCNITGFSAGQVQRNPIIPCWWIVIGFIIGSILIYINIPLIYFRIYVPYGTQHVGIGIFILSIAGMIVDFNQSTRYGLILTLNSGDKHLFITTDWENLSRVITLLHRFIESKQEGVYLVNVTDNSIKIEGNMTGVVTAGTKDTTISSNANNSNNKK